VVAVVEDDEELLPQPARAKVATAVAKVGLARRMEVLGLPKSAET
jgi:hypothetical protein